MQGLQHITGIGRIRDPGPYRLRQGDREYIQGVLRGAAGAGVFMQAHVQAQLRGAFLQQPGVGDDNQCVRQGAPVQCQGQVGTNARGFSGS